MHAGVDSLRRRPGLSSVEEMPERVDGKEEEIPGGDAGHRHRRII